MAGELQFNISARDQATHVVESVQKKLMHMGAEIGKGIVAVVGPIALLEKGFEKIMEHIQEVNAKAKAAFDWGSTISDQASRLGVTVEEFQRLTDVSEKVGEPVEKVARAYKEAADLLASARAGNAEAANGIRALGERFSDLSTVKPEDIINAIGGALAAVEDPAKKAATAAGLFGKEMKDVLATLEKLRGMGVEGGPVLTTGEALFLKEQTRLEKEKEMKDRLESARKQVTARFLEEDPAGRALLESARAGNRSMAPLGAGMPGGGALTSLAGAQFIGPISERKDIQDQVIAILAERARAEAEKNKPTSQDAATAGRLQAIAEASKAKPEKPIPEKMADFGGERITVSSLRAMGGATVGETVAIDDLMTESVQLQRDMLKSLQAIEAGIVRTDFTKLGETDLGNGPMRIPSNLA